MTDYKQLCAELLAALESWSPNGGAPLEEGAEAIAEARLIERARAALSQPEPAGLSDEELLQIAAKTIKPYEDCGIGIDEYEAETECAVEAYGSELIAFARAAIAADRAQRQPVQPEPGEVGDEARYLAKELRDQADDMSPALELFGLMHRAADLLSQRHPQPVPVASGCRGRMIAMRRGGVGFAASTSQVARRGGLLAPLPSALKRCGSTTRNGSPPTPCPCRGRWRND